jgi:succinylglutamic semialdehyde dehydrogenase
MESEPQATAARGSEDTRRQWEINQILLRARLALLNIPMIVPRIDENTRMDLTVETDPNVSESEIISYEPATGAELWRGKVSDVDEAVDRARRAWPSWAAQPLSTRMELVRRFANEVRKDSEKIATTIAREVGKPLWEATAEVESVVNQVEISIRAYAERTAQRKLDNALQGTMALRHKPHGVMAVLGPFSSPAELPNGHIVPALIAGNAVIFKPSEKAPATGEALVRCLNRAGIPASVVQLVIGGPAEGQDLVVHEGVDGVLFTGSAHAGITINRKLAARPDKIAALEMGGSNPLVVWDTPKFADAAALIIQSAFATAGQRCTAARRLIVKSSLVRSGSWPTASSSAGRSTNPHPSWGR